MPVYIKNLKIDPIRITLTFRSAPGHHINSNTNQIISDFGLSLVSIDQARINLDSLYL